MTNYQKDQLFELHGRTLLILKNNFPSGSQWTYSHRLDPCVINAYCAIWERLGWSVEVTEIPSGLLICVMVDKR